MVLLHESVDLCEIEAQHDYHKNVKANQNLVGDVLIDKLVDHLDSQIQNEEKQRTNFHSVSNLDFSATESYLLGSHISLRLDI